MDPTTSPLIHTQVKAHITSLTDPAEALAWIEELLESSFDRSPQELAHMFAGILDAMYDRIDDLLEPYMAVKRSDELQQDVLRIDNDLLFELMDGFAYSTDGNLSETSIDRWNAQKGDKK